MGLNRFISPASKAEKRERNKNIILDYLKEVGGASSVDAAWNLRDKVNPMMGCMEMAMYLRNLEVLGVLTFKEGKYQVVNDE